MEGTQIIEKSNNCANLKRLQSYWFFFIPANKLVTFNIFIIMNETLNVERMKIYVLNIEPIYKVYYWLSECVKKRMNKGLAVSAEHLVKCSTSYKIARMCAEVCRDMDGSTPTNEEKRTFRGLLAEMIISDAKEI